MLNFTSPPRELPPASASPHMAWGPKPALPKGQSTIFHPHPSFKPCSVRRHPVTTHCPAVQQWDCESTFPRAPACMLKTLYTELLSNPETSHGASTGTSLCKHQEMLKKRLETAKEEIIPSTEAYPVSETESQAQNLRMTWKIGRVLLQVGRAGGGGQREGRRGREISGKGRWYGGRKRR